MLGKIFIENLIVACWVGAYAPERKIKQDVRLDVSCHVDVARAASSDDINDTVNYHALYDAIHELARTHTFRLLERLASEVADLALANARVMSVTVRAVKPHKLPQCAGVGVEITKIRDPRSEVGGDRREAHGDDRKREVNHENGI